MKVLTILGTRPEIIRLSLLIRKLDVLCQHVLVLTGQNFDPRLSDIFFEQLGIRAPDFLLKVQGERFGIQIGDILKKSEQVLLEERPDRLLVLGDTNSALAAIVAKRSGIPVYHMEAGNRCYDDRVPEEVNRRIIDHCSDVLMPYTERSRMNLLGEGISGERIYVTGNPIYEVIQHFDPEIHRSTILKDLGLERKRYFLATMHRSENVDIEMRLKDLTVAMDRLQHAYRLPVIISTHPHTQARMNVFDISLSNDQVRFLSPLGFFDFIALEKNAICVLSDSGTVQEECCIFKIPNVTIRDVTERPETLECGSNMLSGVNPERILQCVATVLDRKGEWVVPPEYLTEHVSDTVCNILLGFHWQGFHR
jgi:UDP-N-acetylglucosamine 2-epimerase (non-hydrolysing)